MLFGDPEFIEFAFVDFLGGLLNERSFLDGNVTQLTIDVGGGPFDEPIGMNDAGIDGLMGDREIQNGPLRGGTVEGFSWNGRWW